MYPNFKNYDEYNHYVLSYASNQDVAELEKKIDDVQKDQEGQSDIPLVDGKIPSSYLPSNLVTVGKDGVIPSSVLPSYVDDVVEVTKLPSTGESGKIYILVEGETATQYRWTGTQFAEITSGGVVVGTTTGTAYDGGKGTELETKVADLEATVSDKLGVDDVAVWAKSEDPTLIPSNKLDDHVVKYSDFSYVPGGEAEPVARKTIQLNNYDSISGMNVEGNDATNLIMMSKWNKVDIGSPRYPVNLNGSEFTLNDEKVIATTDQIPDVSDFITKEEAPNVFETKGLTELETGESSVNIEAALGMDFTSLVETIRENKTIIVDRNSAGDYKACIHATGNISGGNGAANLMFFVGTKPTIYQVQYVNETYALAVTPYEFAAKSDIPDTSTFVTETALGDYVKKDEILDTVVDENKNEKLSQALPIRTLLPIQRTTDVTNKSEASIFSEYFNPKVTDRGSLRTYLQSNIAYISYNFVSPGMKVYQYYKIPITMADIPDTGDIKIIAVGADVNNNDVITKFTFTITLNGDASSVHMEKKALEV